MLLSRENFRHPEFRQGAAEMVGVATGIAAWGLMTGVAMVKSGMSTAEALLMAGIVFAGSSQLAAIPLILAGAPIWVVLATAMCVNLRFVVFSVHMRPYVMHMPLRDRLLAGYLTGDLTYVLFVKRFAHPGADDAERRAGILNFTLQGWDNASLFEQLRQQQVVCAQRGAGIRLSPHFYTPVEVLDDTLALLRQWASRG